MPISGPVVHQQLMDAYAQVQSDLQQAHARVSQAGSKRDELLDHRGESLVELAEHYLPELSEQAIRDTWAEVRPAISQVLLRKEHQCKKIRTELERSIANRSRFNEELMTLNASLDQAMEAQEEVASLVEQELREDPEFVRLSDRAAIAEAAIERGEANLQEIDQDSARKLPAYEQSALFNYLKNRDFGTGNYKSRGFTRRMDRWVAKMVNYNKAKQSYDFLRDTPNHMRQIIAEDRASLDVVMQDLKLRRDRVADKHGLPKQIEQIEKLHARRDDLLANIDQTLIESDELQKELNEVDDQRGPFYREAIDTFRKMLSEVDTRTLERKARSTVEITDDQIVARLMGVDQQIDSFDDATRRQHEDLTRMQSFLEGFGRLIQRFRAAGFDSSRSQFVGSLDILEELGRARSEGDIEMLWQRIRSDQRWGPTAIEKITAVATHPMTQVLLNAMAHAAGGAMEAHARRAGQRRRDSGPWDHRAKGSSKWGGDSSSGNYGRRR
ncbi:hypothetical protein Pla22_14970 [Rubripirellula amarantea]|uniref:Chromosome partition protein Smc n=1 Tax=Rubripirellula amarantea TaxID=2527999 RepID=A0A5C5WV26_9BACT|nr:hypothetical protein [Rubripirellula amarantea]TWT53863.1 hypothetical protein Pla22_14970 [Rubripirellula amarantea]